MLYWEVCMSKRILIVDDDADSRKLVGRMLEQLGHTPIQFGSGAAALKYLDSHEVELALLDVVMPEMDGYRLLDTLRSSVDRGATPVIMITAKDKDRDFTEGYQHGADYYLTKPFTLEQLRYGLQMLLQQR